MCFITYIINIMFTENQISWYSYGMVLSKRWIRYWNVYVTRRQLYPCEVLYIWLKNALESVSPIKIERPWVYECICTVTFCYVKMSWLCTVTLLYIRTLSLWRSLLYILALALWYRRLCSHTMLFWNILASWHISGKQGNVCSRSIYSSSSWRE